MRHEIIPIPSELSFEVTSNSGQELVEAAEAKLDKLPAIKTLLQNLQAAHLPSYYHCLRVGEVASSLAEDEADAESLFTSGVLHDIGKIRPGIPELLDKPAQLTPAEKETVSEHSMFGATVISQQLKNSTSGTPEHLALARAAFVAQYHHASFKELECTRVKADCGVLAIEPDELEYRKRQTHLVHLVDQIDARTDLTRPYLLGTESRQNIGVERSAQHLVVYPEALWGEIARDFYEVQFCGSLDSLAQSLFSARFGNNL